MLTPKNELTSSWRSHQWSLFNGSVIKKSPLSGDRRWCHGVDAVLPCCTVLLASVDRWSAQPNKQKRRAARTMRFWIYGVLPDKEGNFENGQVEPSLIQAGKSECSLSAEHFGAFFRHFLGPFRHVSLQFPTVSLKIQKGCHPDIPYGLNIRGIVKCSRFQLGFPVPNSFNAKINTLCDSWWLLKRSK